MVYMKDNKNKDWLIAILIAIAATVALVIVFRVYIGNKQLPEDENANNATTHSTSTPETVDLEKFVDESLGITFQYPKNLKLVTNGEAPTDQSLWLQVSAVDVTEALKEKYWQENLSKLALGEVVGMPGDSLMEKTALSASAGTYPATIYSEANTKNCQANYVNKLVTLVDNKLVMLALYNNSSLTTEDLKEFKATSTAETVECQNKVLDDYNVDALVENIQAGKISNNIITNLQVFKNILTTLEITKTKTAPVASSTPAYVGAPTISSGELKLGIDEVVYLQGDEAKAQMKADDICQDDCQVPEGGYLVNQTKKFKAYKMSLNLYIAVMVSASSTTPAQLTPVSLPGLVKYLKQVDSTKQPVFDVYFDEQSATITGLTQKQ